MCDMYVTYESHVYKLMPIVLANIYEIFFSKCNCALPTEIDIHSFACEKSHRITHMDENLSLSPINIIFRVVEQMAQVNIWMMYAFLIRRDVEMIGGVRDGKRVGVCVCVLSQPSRMALQISIWWFELF